MNASTTARTCAVLLLALAMAPAARADDAPVVQSTQHGDFIEIRASAHLAADRETAWRVLTDYERYPEFIPDLRSSRVVSRDGTTVVVEQEGDAALGPFRIPLAITFQIHERAPQAIESRAVAGSLRSLESRYALTTRAGGTQLTYAGIVRIGWPLIEWFAQSAVEANVRRQFVAMVDEIERRRGANPTGR